MEKISFVPDQTPIKLLTMEYSPTRGGAGVYCEELAHAMDVLEGNIEVLAPQGSYSESSVKLTQLPFKGSQDWWCSWKIRKFLNRQNLEKTNLHIGDPGALRAMIRFGWTIPKPYRLIVTIHGSEIPKFTKGPVERLFFKSFLKNADKVHVLSNYNKERLSRFCPDIKNKILLIPGAPARDILPKPNPVENKDYSKKNLVLLCVGRIHPRKGQLLLLQAIEKLPGEIKERITCWFVGPQTKPGYAKKVIEKSSQVGCDVKFLGDLKSKDLKEAYQNADIFALTSIPMPSSVEGFGIVYLEASSHGLPVLAHRVGGVEDAILDGKTGLLSDPNKPDQLLENLKNLIEKPEKRKELGEAGAAWAAKHSWEKIAQRLYELA